MAGGARDGAGRPPVPIKKQKQSITVTIRPDQVKWVRETKPRGWLAKLIEKAIDSEMLDQQANAELSGTAAQLHDKDTRSRCPLERLVEWRFQN